MDINIDMKEAIQAELFASDPDIKGRLQKFEASMSRLTPRQRARVVFARTFRAEMRALRLTQKELAEKLGVSPSLVSAWASAVSLPNPEQTEKLSDLFGSEVSLWAVYDAPLPQDPQEMESRGDSYDVAKISTSTPALNLADEEIALIQRVRRMSQEERDALYTLLHVLR